LGRGRERGFVLYNSLFEGVRVVGVCVFVYARTHTQNIWLLDVSPGVRRTPGEPEEPRSTKAHIRVDRIGDTVHLSIYMLYCGF